MGASESGSDDTMAAEALGEVVVAPGHDFAGRYRIVRELGRGGMGVVFVAHDLEVGEDIALKVLPPATEMRPEALERFRREVRLAAASRTATSRARSTSARPAACTT